MQKLLFLLLIIYTGFSSKLIAQNLQLNIIGADSTETQVIDSLSYLKFHKDYTSLVNEVDTTNFQLNRLGFIESKINSVKKINDTLFIAHLNLNKQYKNIYVYYDSALVPKNILKTISSNVQDSYFTIEVKNTEATLETLNLRLSENGQPFSTLKLTNIKAKDNNDLEAVLVVSEKSTKRTIDKIVIRGYEKFSKSYLKHFLKLKTKEPFNLTKIKNRSNQLQSLRFAKQLKEPEVLFTKDSTVLYLYIEKIKSNTFDGFLGFGTNEETNKLEFNGYLNLELNNNLNFGESLNVIYKSDENDQKTFNAKVNLPYLLGTPIGAELELGIFKKDSTFSTVNQNANVFYQIHPKHKTSLGIKSIKSNNLLSNDNSLESIKDYAITFYNVGYQFKNPQTQNRLFPVNALFDIEIGTGKRQFDETTENQIRTILDTYKIFNLNNKNSVLLRVNGFKLFSESFLENELVRFGGINSIRGFEENSLLASFYALLNTEYRYTLSNNIYVHSIIDFSYLENEITQQKEKLYGFGLGFGIITKAGLLKFNYANGKNENQKFKLSNSQIHLSLSAIF